MRDASVLINEIKDFFFSPLRKECLDFIVDKTIPIKERWAVFKNMPIEWSSKNGYLITLNWEKKLPEGRINWYDDYNVQRMETVDFVDFVEDNTNFLCEDTNEECDEFNLPRTTELVEEILQRNIKTFVYDW